MAREWLILHVGALGDLILTVQLAQRVIDDAAALHVISRVDPGPLTHVRPPVFQTHSDVVGLHWLHGDSRRPPDALYDLVCDKPVFSALGDDASPVTARIEHLDPATLLAIDPRPREGDRRHIVDQWRAQLRAPYGERFTVREPPAHAAPPRILLHPGSGGRRKCWPAGNFLAVATQLVRLQIDVRFLLGPVEQERWPTAVLRSLESAAPLEVCESGAALVAALRGARVLVANDSGPGHLAALLGLRVLSLFGPTEAAVWRPLSPHSVVLSGDPQQDERTWGLDLADVAERAAGLLEV